MELFCKICAWGVDFMRWMILFLFLLCIVGVSAYQVNVPINVLVKLQQDNGTALTLITSQVCIGSVYFHGNDSLLVRDELLINTSLFHNLLFTPLDFGVYTVSVKCTYAGESAIYREDLVVSPSLVDAGSGGQVLVLNSVITPERDVFVVNLRDDSRLSFLTTYAIGDTPSNAVESYFKVMKDDNVIKTGSFRLLRTGVYQLDFDFGQTVVGEYVVYLFFDGKTGVVDVRVIDSPVGLITGLVFASDGSVNVRNALLFIGLLILLIVVVWWLLHRRKEKKAKHL